MTIEKELEMLREQVKYLEEKIELMKRIEELKELLKQKEQTYPYPPPIVIPPHVPYQGPYEKYKIWWSTEPNFILCKEDVIIESGKTNYPVSFKDTQC